MFINSERTWRRANGETASPANAHRRRRIQGFRGGAGVDIELFDVAQRVEGVFPRGGIYERYAKKEARDCQQYIRIRSRNFLAFLPRIGRSIPKEALLVGALP